ncbi:MAG: GIY-YIG nuclease family protein [Flavobacteriales bacterium]|jgi:putative endonuclease|nr:GIY-YIG nuclease family protein [Flavobacteriales bacterium]
MQEFVTYILYSNKFNKIYIGYSSSLINRFYSHNKLATKGYTIRYRPWVVIYVDFFEQKTKAIKHEKFLKSGKGRDWIKNTLIPKYQQLGFISALG